MQTQIYGFISLLFALPLGGCGGKAGFSDQRGDRSHLNSDDSIGIPGNRPADEGNVVSPGEGGAGDSVTVEVVPSGIDQASGQDGPPASADVAGSTTVDDPAVDAESADRAAVDSAYGTSEQAGQNADPAQASTSVARISDEEAAECRGASGGRGRVMFVSEKSDQQVTSDSTAVVKITGNQSTFTLTVKGAGDDARLAALCLFVTGNQSNVILDIRTSVDHIVYKGRGNKSTVVAKVPTGATVARFTPDIKGNVGSFTFEGQGVYPK